ncbi:MAG TPA: hypothetical protein VN734_04540, partial [Acidobacteriaceae bacterium]|nr:hypothetical protein [Acidobacteriaceae bacterium]
SARASVSEVFIVAGSLKWNLHRTQGRALLPMTKATFASFLESRPSRHKKARAWRARKSASEMAGGRQHHSRRNTLI